MNPDVSEIREQKSNCAATIAVCLSVCAWQGCVRRQYGRVQLPGALKYLFQEATSKLRTLEELDKVSSEEGEHELQPTE